MSSIKEIISFMEQNPPKPLSLEDVDRLLIENAKIILAHQAEKSLQSSKNKFNPKYIRNGTSDITSE